MLLLFFFANQDLKQNGNFNLSHYFHTYKISTCKPKKKKDCVNLLFEKNYLSIKSVKLVKKYL